MSERALEAARESGLVEEGAPLLVLLSGGVDSVCLLDVAKRLGAELSVLHVNHGLRDAARDDERHCRDLCRALGVPIVVERPDPPEGGNVQALARELRYALAERHAADRYATGHTASDQAETVLYRMATSPGSRALSGMRPARGRLVRPLLRVLRADTVAYCEARGLDWREDASNADPRFARARIRAEVMPVLRAIGPAAEETIAQTASEMQDEATVLEAAAREAAREVGAPAPSLERLRRLEPALARLVLRRLVEEAAGVPRALSAEQARAVLSLGEAGSRALDLGGGLRAVAEYGTLRFTAEEDARPPEAVPLPIPGSARFGTWQVDARLGDGGDVVLTAESLGPLALVRPWRDGDRMRPLGLGGSKSLQDIFTDRKVPRALRRTLPVVEVGGEIAWVAGVAVGERFTPAHSGWDWLQPDDSGLVSLSARRVPGP